jgi:hypothetical protein
LLWLQVETVVDERLLQQWADLTDKAPKVSLGAFLTAVAAADRQYGGQVSSIQTPASPLLL